MRFIDTFGVDDSGDITVESKPKAVKSVSSGI